MGFVFIISFFFILYRDDYLSGIPLQIVHTYTHHMLCCRITTQTFYIFNKF